MNPTLRNILLFINIMITMRYFSPSFFTFFKELAANNHKEWFHANKKTYEKEVKEPFKQFIGDLIQETHKIDREIDIQPKDAIFRINRDIRFAKDKSPYKLNVAANISAGGRKAKEEPGFYVHFSPESTFLGGGAYWMDKVGLYQLRLNMAEEPDAFQKLIASSEFQEKYGEVKGEKNARIPKEFKAALSKQPLIANKQFYYMAEVPPEKILDDDLLDFTLEYYKAGRDFNHFLKKALAH